MFLSLSMKSFSHLAAILFLAPLSSLAQFDFEPDTAKSMETHLPPPNFDSVAFVVRIWQSGQIGESFYQLTFAHDSSWSYRRGIFDRDEYSAIELPLMKEPPNLGALWKHLDSLEIRTLKSQHQSTVSIVHDGKIYTFDEEQLEKMIGLHSPLYTVELFNSEGYRSYFYFDPTAILKLNKPGHQLIAPEHERMAAIIEAVKQEFHFEDVISMMKEKWYQKQKSQKK